MSSAGEGTADKNPDGTQAIRRAASILRIIGQGGGQGVGLSVILKQLDLPRSTAHRILKCLVEEGLVGHQPDKRRYVVGRLTHELGLTVTPDVLEIARWRATVDRVARRTGATSYLMSRSGIEATCIHKAEGNAVIRAIPVEVGQRRYLGIGAGSIALLAQLDAETIAGILETIAPVVRSYPDLSLDYIRKVIAETQRTGFAVSVGTVSKGVIGIGHAVPEPGGTPSLAVSIAALASQTDETMIADWKAVIGEEILATAEAGSVA